MQVGDTWAGKYSRWSFDEDKAYQLVAKEMLGPADQALPLLDDELNCQAEIQLTLLRRAIKRIFGNGSDNEGFKIAESSTNTSNNFQITGGDGTIDGAGYIFVDGWMPFLKSSVEYNTQTWATTLTTPSSTRTDYVYLDCWLEEIAGADDSGIIESTIGFETSRRLKLSWKIIVDEGLAERTTDPYLDANNDYHYITPLATIERSGINIYDSMICDTRNKNRGLKKVEHFHNQTTASTTWNIEHSLDTLYILIDIWDASGNKIEAPVEILDENNCRIVFGSSSVSGNACIKGLTTGYGTVTA